MMQNWSFGKRLGAGLAVVIALTVATGVVAMFALGSVVTTKDKVIEDEVPLLLEAERVRANLERRSAAQRAFLLTGEQRFIDEAGENEQRINASFARLRKEATAERRLAIEALSRLREEHQLAAQSVITARRNGAAVESVAKQFEEMVVPWRTQLDTALEAFVATEAALVERVKADSSAAAASATNIILAMGGAAVVLGILLAVALTRTLGRQVGSAVGSVQSSAAELQAAANQQATSAKEQATAMNEITTTINELLATSRQIAESAQRVTQIASQTATLARSGDGTVEKANESIAGIRRQVDLVVNHMLDLGKRSQEIGAVLDIVSELAEQTNILAINATIEGAGAGDAGKRFGVVADEIRKLADRVAGSTKEVRALIEDVRGAVNRTVMATETGSKAVDAGARQFGEVATAFKQIAGMVVTTTDASREIELSTKQQRTAVEQVNIAIENVAQATKETEVSSGQTLLTASQLATLSGDLIKMVQPRAS